MLATFPGIKLKASNTAVYFILMTPYEKDCHSHVTDEETQPRRNA